eukprot:NODE_780_length_1355_cov_391.740429_g570_i0.p1 GENE.NODE_780_length_1355_cov_391.740429_g570_i0~~NODE_780_length_1355_cov_391.740429_g570_i0.p1  ORF type:complete len:366 (-),score=72.44 NODE_780_length_1355_cov_391.740429_g570_i0:202-1299(-)
MSATKLVIACAACLIACFSLSCFIATSQPNEWLLKISNGEMVSAGVGMTCFLGPFDKVVRFPASIHKVSFSASQVTKEMQGVDVSGFIVWAVHRQGEGPFKAYKYLGGLTEAGIESANEQIRGMAESIIRHQVANLHLNEVIKNREVLRQKVRSQMLEVVAGWGMWLETVEVTDVRVSSNTVFKELQSEFRMELHSRAEEVRMNTTRDISTMQTAVDTEVVQKKDAAEALLRKNRLWQQLEEKQEEARVEKELQELALAKLEQERILNLQKVKNEAEAQNLQQEESIKLQRLKSAAEWEIAKAQMEMESQMSPASLQKYVVDAAKEIYSELPLKEVKLFHTGSGNSLESLLPGLSQAFEQLKESK